MSAGITFSSDTPVDSNDLGIPRARELTLAEGLYDGLSLSHGSRTTIEDPVRGLEQLIEAPAEVDTALRHFLGDAVLGPLALTTLIRRMYAGYFVDDPSHVDLGDLGVHSSSSSSSTTIGSPVVAALTWTFRGLRTFPGGTSASS